MSNPFENFKNLGRINMDFEEYEHPIEGETQEILQEAEEKPNLFGFYFITIILGLILIFRLLDLQIAQGAKHQYLAEGNRLRSRDIPAPRGNIYDQNGQILAKNIASYNLEIYPADLPKNKVERQKIYQEIEKYSQISVADVAKDVEEQGLYSLEPIILKANLPRDEAQILEIRYQDLSGVVINKVPIRQYQISPGLAHVLGYVGKITQTELDKNSHYQITDNFGKSGVELTYESLLKGVDGQEQVEVDSLGRIQRTLATKQPSPGNNLYLTIDLGLQQEMAKDLSTMSDQLGGREAVTLAVNPQNGAILGLVNLPSYDDNIFSQANLSQEYQKILEDPNKPLLNRAISGLYPSGSTIKPMIAAAGLQEKVITAKTTINDPGEIKIGDWTFPDWKNHGLVNVQKAIAESCDVFFYAVGGGYDKISGLGVARLDQYLEKFGFGSNLGIDLGGESAGLVPSPAWKKKVKKESWYVGDTYHLAIGQGDLLVTPLQLVNAIATIANGGKLYQPHVLSKETDNSGQLMEEFPAKIIREGFIDSNYLDIVREGMRQTVTSGSGRALNDLPVAAAGKTGTAQFGSESKTHSWFVSFAPYDNPQIALVVLIEGGGEGNETAVPVAKQILQYYFTRGQ